MPIENVLGEDVELSCPCCNFVFAIDRNEVLIFENGALNKCPACSLTERIDDHISQVLKSIIINHYAPYLFERDDKSALINDAMGYSYRQTRKHNLSIIGLLSETSFNNFYMLIAAHLEAAFYDIEQVINKYRSKDSIIKYFADDTSYLEKGKKNVFRKYNLYSVYKQNKLNIQARFKNSGDFIKHVSNVITHNMGMVQDERSGSALINKYKFKDGVPLYIQTHSINSLGKPISIRDYYKLTCMTYVFLKDVVASLLILPKLKEKNLDVVKITNNLVDMQIRRDISEFMWQRARDDILFSPDGFGLRYMNSDDICEYLKNKEKLLRELNKINPKLVFDYEIYGNLNVDVKLYNWNDKITRLYYSLHGMERRSCTAKPYKITKSSLKKFRSMMDSILSKLNKKYGEDLVGYAIFNEFDKLHIPALPSFMIDFYHFINIKNKSDLTLIIRIIGICPFQRWNPFLFGVNYPMLK